MQKKWLFAGLLVLLALMTACGPSGKPSSANTIPTATPGANPGGAATATPAPTATPVPPTQVPPANAGIAGVWAGSAPNGAATHAIIAECGGSAFAALTLPDGSSEVAQGPGSHTSATLSGIAYQNHAPAYKDAWTVSLQSSNVLQVMLNRQPIAKGTAAKLSNTLALSTTAIPGAPDFSGTWNGTQNTQTDQIPIRFVISQCGPMINAAIYLSQNDQLPSSPQETGLGTMVNGQMTVETTFSVSAGYFFYDRWSMTLAGSNHMTFTDFTHYLDPGDTTPDTTTTGSADR